MSRFSPWSRGAILALAAMVVTGCPSSMPTAPSLAFSNIHDQRAIESGFVVGTASSSGSTIVLVEVKTDGGAFEPAAGTDSWRYRLPTGPAAWKPGSSHTITARARDANGGCSEERSVTVVRGTNRDVDGDGFADGAVGAPYLDAATKRGRLYLFAGGSAGVASAAAGSAATIVTGESDFSRLGYSISLGDVDGDGYADIAAGAPYFNSNQGRVYVFYGSSAGIASTDASAAYTILTGEEGSGFFGFSVSLGNIDGDACSDLVVGAFSRDSGTGAAYVYLGSSAGIHCGDASSADTLLTGETGSSFGYSVAVGDVNGDDCADVVVGAPNWNSGQGRAYVFHGSATGIATTGATSADTILTGESSGFGYAIAVGDVNADGYADLATGAPAYAAMQGVAYVFHGGVTGIASGDAASAVTVLSGEAGSAFGCALSFGDVNGDGCADLALGAALSGSEQGRAYVFHGGPEGVPDAGAGSADTILEGPPGTGDFGCSTAFADVTADGCADLEVGAYYFDAGDGAAYVFEGSPSGIPSRGAGAADTVLTGEDGVGGFGYSLAQ